MRRNKDIIDDKLYNLINALGDLEDAVFLKKNYGEYVQFIDSIELIIKYYESSFKDIYNEFPPELIASIEDILEYMTKKFSELSSELTKTYSEPIKTHISMIDNQLSNEKLSEETINLLLDERLQLKE